MKQLLKNDYISNKYESGNFKKKLFLLVLLICCLAPFLNKAFHIDDPTFIGMAKYIQAHPFDYFGYYMQFSPPVITNPPLVAYLIVIPGSLFGYSEIVIHSFFILPAIAVITGTWLLASDMSADPFIAALTAICTPVFILSSTTVMCDVPMLAFWVFAIYFWRKGIKEGKRGFLAASSFMITLCVMTKYMGICLVPLLMAYTIAEKRKAGEWILYLMLPVITLLLFDQLTYAKYGLRQISFIESWSVYNHVSSGKNYYAKIITGFAFLGGCILAHSIYFVCRTRGIVLFIYLAIIVSVLLLLLKNDFIDHYPIANADGINWLFVVQLPFFVFAGVSVMIMLIRNFMKQRNADTMLLLLWMVGVFLFAVFINWSVNGRTIIPIVPAAGIMLSQFYKIENDFFQLNNVLLFTSLLFSLAVSLAITHADTAFANSARSAALGVKVLTKNCHGNKWYEGHWGFEHYITRSSDYRILNYNRPRLSRGDTVIIPSTNTNTKHLYKHLALIREVHTFPLYGLFSTMSLSRGAGFYADVYGPLPFAIGTSPENYYEYEVITDKSSAFSY